MEQSTHCLQELDKLKPGFFSLGTSDVPLAQLLDSSTYAVVACNLRTMVLGYILPLHPS
jgi:hypothetical protein